MADFSYQYYQSLLLDSVHIPLLPQQIEETSHASSCFLHYYKSDAIAESSEIETRAYESSGSLVSVRKPDGGVEISRPQVSMEKKRKINDQSFLTSVQSKDSKKIRYSRKQKKPIGMKQKEAKKLLKACEMKRSCEEASVGYIHVRARRGQATDSHSLAERVRREKISERMKRLQALVPGCDKVTGNALILDEIINYVQSLQNKVEFLSLKLASLNPILYDFGVDLDVQMNQMERLEGFVQDSQLVPSVSQTSPFHPTAQSLLHGQGPIAFSPSINVGEERQGFLNQVVLDSKCSFH